MNILNKQVGTFKSFDDTDIYYELRGQGEPIIFCYGIGCLMNHWNHQIKNFSNDYQTIMFDYRGHGKSSLAVDKKNVNVKSFAKDLHCLLEKLNIKKAHFVSHSFGAQVLTEAYSQNNKVFNSITFINGFVDNPLEHMFNSKLPMKAFEFLKRAQKTAPDATEALWKASIDNPISAIVSAFVGGFNINLTEFKDIEIYVKCIANLDLSSFLKLFEDMTLFNGTPILSLIDRPCLIISGNKDTITPVSHQEKMHQLIKGSELSILPYGSHCTQLDLPEYVNMRMEKFLNH